MTQLIQGVTTDISVANFQLVFWIIYHKQSAVNIFYFEVIFIIQLIYHS